MPPVPAGPKTFHFKTRILDADAKPFGEREYLIVWGKERVRGLTTPDGDVEALLSGGIQRGVLHLGTDEGGFNAYISIPITVVPPYPPPPAPVIIEPPPPPRPRKEKPQPPVGPEAESWSSSDWETFHEKVREWEEYDKQRSEEERLEQDARRELERYEREQAEAQRRSEQEGGPSAAPQHPSPPGRDPGGGSGDWQKRVDAVNQSRRQTYDLHRVQYELFWRLRNLAYLTEEFRGKPNFMMRGGDVSRRALEDACRRYCHKHQLTIPKPTDFSAQPIPDCLIDLLEHVKTFHDTREWGLVGPVP